MSYSTYVYLADPLRLSAVYGSKDRELARAVQRSSKPWVSEDEDADMRALDAIIDGATLDPSARATYTLVLQWICGTVGVDAWQGADEDDQELAEQEPEPIETLNAVL